MLLFLVLRSVIHSKAVSFIDTFGGSMVWHHSATVFLHVRKKKKQQWIPLNGCIYWMDRHHNLLFIYSLRIFHFNRPHCIRLRWRTALSVRHIAGVIQTTNIYVSVVIVCIPINETEKWKFIKIVRIYSTRHYYKVTWSVEFSFCINSILLFKIRNEFYNFRSTIVFYSLLFTVQCSILSMAQLELCTCEKFTTFTKINAIAAQKPKFKLIFHEHKTVVIIRAVFVLATKWTIMDCVVCRFGIVSIVTWWML